MDPITHAVAGIVIGSKAGMGLSFTNGLMIASTLGAVAPDLDITTRLWGDYVYLGQHRKFSHSLPGIFIISILIGVILTPLYTVLSFWQLFFWAVLGGLSHSFLDMFNSYGVSLLWPVKKQKLSFNLLLIFDPTLFILLLVLVYAGNNLIINLGTMGIFIGYLLIRWLMRQGAYQLVKKSLQEEYPDSKLTILPLRFSVWDFIASFPDKKIVGTVDSIKRKVRILGCLENIRNHLGQAVLASVLGKYFVDFTPYYHISCESSEGKYIARLMDLRYRVKDRFLHNATLVMDDNLKVEEAIFQPFNLSRKIYLNI
jgi:inner membrane protein